MAFKHIRENITNTNTDQTIYTVPAGKEFVLMRKRARDASADHVGTVTFKLGTSTIEELSFSSSIAEIGEGTKLLCEAGNVIKARSTFAGAMAEAMGVEFKAGTWATVNESNPDSPVIPDTPESSSSSSIEPEQSSSSSSQGGGDSFSWGTTPSIIIASTSYPSFDGTYNWNSNDSLYKKSSSYTLYQSNDAITGIDVYYCLERDAEVYYYCTSQDLLTGSWINSGGSSVDVTVSIAGNSNNSSSSSEQGGGNGVFYCTGFENNAVNTEFYDAGNNVYVSNLNPSVGDTVIQFYFSNYYWYIESYEYPDDHHQQIAMSTSNAPSPSYLQPWETSYCIDAAMGTSIPGTVTQRV